MEELNIWASIFISLIGVIIAAKYFHQHFVWWEYFVGVITSIIVTGIFLLVVVSNINDDTEYWGSIAVRARYVEAYETYEHRTCYRTVSCGKNCTTTVPYDCSYCDENDTYWEVYDNLGSSYYISKEEYYRLYKLWGSVTPKFVELNRDINYSGSCGDDGDAYDIYWDKNIYHNKSITTSKTYVNPTVNANSAFKYKNWSEQQVKEKGLFNYPEVKNHYQTTIQGIVLTDSMQKLFDYLNAYSGSMFKCRFNILFFKDKSQEIALQQESYWKNGNQNEINICIGYITPNIISWVKVFGWNNQYMKINLREEIANLKVIDLPSLYNICILSLKDYKINDLQKEFNYLKPELPLGIYITIYILNTIITVLILIWCVKNNIYD